MTPEQKQALAEARKGYRFIRNIEGVPANKVQAILNSIEKRFCQGYLGNRASFDIPTDYSADVWIEERLLIEISMEPQFGKISFVLSADPEGHSYKTGHSIWELYECVLSQVLGKAPTPLAKRVDEAFGDGFAYRLDSWSEYLDWMGSNLSGGHDYSSMVYPCYAVTATQSCEENGYIFIPIPQGV